MKYLPQIAAVLLGLMFVAFSLIYFFNLMSPEPPPEGSPASMFYGAMAPSGYFDFIKACELVGGILVMIPVTRFLGLLILGPIIVNILAFHVFIMGGAGLVDPILIAIVVLALFLLCTHARRLVGTSATK
ncbi:MAG: hypothetical protein E1N59_1340 [Puniceicoccaceae bacterium 5H]|nr:MAG: hypothetical protein E1N59_1340 [Puniceicoccaceae bacterium 5H]